MIGLSCANDVNSSEAETFIVRQKLSDIFEYTLQFNTVDQIIKVSCTEENYNADNVLSNSKYHYVLLSFMISPNSDRTLGDLIYSRLHTYKDYQQRVQNLNFNFHSYWEIRTPTDTVPALAAQMDNTYGLTDYRKFQILFAPQDTSIDLYQAPYWEVIFRDEVFETGVHTFRFEREEWESLQ